MMRRNLLLMLALIGSSYISYSYAQSLATISLNVRSQVLGICKIQSVQHIDFGMLDPAQAINTIALGALRIACTRGLNFRIHIDSGQNFDYGLQTRRMKNSSNYALPYILTFNDQRNIGQGFNSPLNVDIKAYISGNDYRDLPTGTYIDVVRVVIEL